MLHDSTISRIAIALAATGLLLLALQLQPEKKNVFEAIKTGNEKQVEIRAKIGWVKQFGENVFFELDDGNKITALFYRGGNTGMGIIKPNAIVSAVGKVSDSNGKKIFFVDNVRAEEN